MSRFVLTAQIQLQAPRNVGQVVSQIQKQLNNVNVNLNVQNGPQATKQIAQVNQQVNKLNKNAKNLGTNFAVSIKKFAAFSIANRAVSLFANKLSSAVEDSIAFQRELIKIKQVSGATDQALSNLTKTITDLSTSLGASSKDLLATSRILAQTGLQAAQLEVALSALAKTTLAPTFENIEKTAEGAVAILAQFGLGVGALESQLGSINAVAGQFAVESGDLISAVRRTGGVFKSAGGDLNELLALFTSVRATTRESAESIATGLRTIFTRIQRPKTIEFLKQYGIELTNLEGKFVGPFDAVRQLSRELQGLEQGDIRFVQIAEELGGFRQIGKVIPLIQQFEMAERARQAATAGSTSLDKDAQTAQLALAVQIEKTRENFLALIRSLSETTTFSVLVKTTLGLADALIKVADSLAPIIPLLGAFAGMKIAKGIGSFAGGLRGAFSGKNAGGPIGFATGGVVPGTGNRDTVPAMLTPGEFVIRKSSVSKLGTDTLTQMNNNKYADGGYVSTKSLIPPPKDGVQGGKTIANTLEANRGKGWTAIDEFKVPYKVKSIDPFDKSVPKALRTDYQNQPTASKRGFAFENIVEAKTGKELKKGNAFLDFKGGEIKSDKSFAEKKSGGLRSKAYKTVVAKALNTLLMTKKVEDLRFTSKKDKRDLSKVTVYTDPSISQWENNRKLIAKGKEPEGLNKGGRVQKFALGGLATKNRVGFAILDPDKGGSDLSASVTRAQIRGAVSGTDAQKKALDKEISWPNKKFSVTRQGLPEKTSQKFYDTIAQEATEGVGRAASSLSQTLGQGSVSMPDSAKETMNSVIKKSGSQMGSLFEDTLNVIDNAGDFKPAPKGAFWDFKRGLTGGLAGTYNKMPSSFVDARTSYGRSTADAAQGKIVGEIAEEYEKSSTYKTAKKQSKPVPASALAAQEKRRAKQAAKMAKMKEQAGYAKGGAASDTVPALLTPGEFVINAKSASKIGKANLDRMNKKGVAGFATGGAVGKVQRFNKGGPSESGSARGGIDAAALAFLLPTVIDSMIPTVEKTDDAISQLGVSSFSTRDAFSSLISTLAIAGVAMSTFGVSLKGLGKQLRGGGIKSLTARKRLFDKNVAKGKRFAEQRQPGAGVFRKNAFDLPTSVNGRGLGGKLGRGIGGGSRLAGLGAGGVSKTLGAVARFAGPIGIAVGGLVAFNSVLKAGFGFQEKYNNAIKFGNVERAKELAVLKEVPAIIALGGKNFSEGFLKFGEFFGGNTLESIKANAEAQALAGKTTKEFEANSKEAADALRELKDGTRTAAEAFASGDLTKNLRNTLEQGAAELKAAQANYTNELNRFGGTFRNWFANLTGLGSTNAEIEETASAKRAKGREKVFASTAKEIDKLKESTRISNRQIILSGGNFGDALKRLRDGLDGVDLEIGLTEEKAKDLGRAFENQSKEIILNLKIAKALNSSFFVLNSQIKGLNASLTTSLDKTSGDFDQLSSTLRNLDTVTKGGTVNQKQFREELKTLQNTLRGFGVDPKLAGDTARKFMDLNNVTSRFGDILNSIRGKVDSDVGTSVNLKEDLRTALIDEVQTASFKDLFKESGFFDDLGLDKVGLDVSEVFNAFVKKAATGLNLDKVFIEDLLKGSKLKSKIDTALFKSQEEIIKTNLAVIDSQISAAERLEEFGIRTFTVSKRLEFLDKKVKEGVGKGFVGTANSLQLAISNASQELENQTKKRAISATPEENVKFANEIQKQTRIIENGSQALKQRISIEKEALKLAKEKIRLDREAIDSLLSGNIEDFLKKQSAAAARRSLLSGNAAAVGQFDLRSIGEAIKSITSPDEKRVAVDTAVASRQITESTGNIFLENTPEISAIRESVEKLSSAMVIASSAQKAAQEAQQGINTEASQNAVSDTGKLIQTIEDSSKKRKEVNEKLTKQISLQTEAVKKSTTALDGLILEIRKERDKEALEDTKKRMEKDVAPSTVTKNQDLSPVTKLPNILSTPEAQRDAKFGAGTAMKQREILRKLNEDTPENRRRKRIYGGLDASPYSRGGLIYASNGMFVPRGTDTVPAMLTPGEFVVNAGATKKNRPILEAINGGASTDNGVYYNRGGEVSSTVDTKALKQIASALSSSFRTFNDTVERLINFKFEMTIAPTRVDVIINTPQAMNSMNSQTKEYLLTAVVDEIETNQLGKLKRKRNA